MDEWPSQVSHVPYQGETDQPFSDARVSGQTQFLNEQLNQTLDIMMELEQRLQLILFPELPTPSLAMKEASPSLPLSSPLSDMLEDANAKVIRLQHRLRVLMERIQL